MLFISLWRLTWVYRGLLQRTQSTSLFLDPWNIVQPWFLNSLFFFKFHPQCYVKKILMVPELFDVFMIFILMLSVAKKGLILSIKKIEITKTIIWSLQNLKREKNSFVKKERRENQNFISCLSCPIENSKRLTNWEITPAKHFHRKLKLLQIGVWYIITWDVSRI